MTRVVLVTGGTRGIGRAVAMRCARDGYRVSNVGRTNGLDVTDPDELSRLVATVEDHLGPIHGLVCAAAIAGEVGPFAMCDFARWRDAIETNLIGAARAVHAVLPYMRQRRAGRIILFSGGGEGPAPNLSAYAASKGGIWRLTETLGAELAPEGIYVNAVQPGPVKTRLREAAGCAGPTVSPDRAADLCAWLLSDHAAGLTGRTISAVWDDYAHLVDLPADRFTFRRQK